MLGLTHYLTRSTSTTVTSVEPFTSVFSAQYRHLEATGGGKKKSKGQFFFGVKPCDENV